jgi:hypothetical protein
MVDNENASTADAGQVDFSAATTFLKVLDPDPNAAFAFQTFDDSEVEPKRDGLTHVLHAPRDRLPNELAALNAAGAGIFVTVNATDGTGRKGTNITRVRALFVDLDGVALEPVLASQFPPPPHMVVNTSPGKFHCYWLVEGIALQDFKAYQEALIERFDGDPLVKSVEHVMRLPGFLHRKGAPYLARIVHINKRPPYAASEFAKKAQSERRAAEGNEKCERNPVLAKMAMIFIPPTLDRELRIKVGQAIHRASGGSEEGYKIWTDWLERGGTWSARKAARSWKGFEPHTVGIHTLVFMANQAVPDWRKQLDLDTLAAMDRAARED